MRARSLSAMLVPVVLALLVAVGGPVVLGSPAGARPAEAGPGAPSEARAGGPRSPQGYLGTAALPVCSAALVRWPTSQPSDPARVLTNGHCVRFPFLGAREVLVDRRAWRKVRLLDADGSTALTVRAVRLEYATMWRTDAAVYRLRETYDDLAARGVLPLTVADRRPVGRHRVTVPSAFHIRTLGCRTRGIARTLHERAWDWRDSLRLPADRGCRLVPGFSGSPVLDRAGRVVAVANTAYLPGGRVCVETACEETRRGRTVLRKRISYAQQVWWLTTCLAPDRSVDPSVAGCRLPAPR